jgi:hypothetical protein
MVTAPISFELVLLVAPAFSTRDVMGLNSLKG